MALVVASLCSLYPVVTVLLAVPILVEKLPLFIGMAVIISSVAGIINSIERTPDEDARNPFEKEALRSLK